jgi:hypothetical protein
VSAAAAPPPAPSVTLKKEEEEQRDPEVDPLDAFMAAEVLPEVKAKEDEERKRAEEESKNLKELLAVSFVICVSAFSR